MTFECVRDLFHATKYKFIIYIQMLENQLTLSLNKYNIKYEIRTFQLLVFPTLYNFSKVKHKVIFTSNKIAISYKVCKFFKLHANKIVENTELTRKVQKHAMLLCRIHFFTKIFACWGCVISRNSTMHTSALESLGVINHTIFQLFFKIKIQVQPIFITEVTK